MINALESSLTFFRTIYEDSESRFISSRILSIVAWSSGAVSMWFQRILPVSSNNMYRLVCTNHVFSLLFEQASSALYRQEEICLACALFIQCDIYLGSKDLYWSIKSPAYMLVTVKKMASPMYSIPQMTFVFRSDS